MNKQMKTNIILGVFSFVALIKDFHLLPVYINIPLHQIICTLSLIADIIVYCYYLRMPDSKKNVLTYVFRLLSVVSGITIVWYNVSQTMIELTVVTKPWLEKYPNLACSMLRSEVMGEMIFVGFTLIQFCKAGLAYNALLFLNLDHERLFKFILSGVIILFLSENIFNITYAGTLCTETKLQRLAKVSQTVIPKDMIKHAPSLYIVHAFVTLIATVIFKIVKIKKMEKNRIVPITSNSLIINVKECKHNIKPEEGHNDHTSRRNHNRVSVATVDSIIEYYNLTIDTPKTAEGDYFSYRSVIDLKESTYCPSFNKSLKEHSPKGLSDMSEHQKDHPTNERVNISEMTGMY